MAKKIKNKKHFLKDVKAELKKVVWLTPKQLIKSTAAVVVIVLVTALIVFLLDVIFETVTTKGLDKIKAIVLEEKSEQFVDFNNIENSTINEVTLENTTTEESK